MPSSRTTLITFTPIGADTLTLTFQPAGTTPEQLTVSAAALAESPAGPAAAAVHLAEWLAQARMHEIPEVRAWFGDLARVSQAACTWYEFRTDPDLGTLTMYRDLRPDHDSQWHSDFGLSRIGERLLSWASTKEDITQYAAAVLRSAIISTHPTATTIVLDFPGTGNLDVFEVRDHAGTRLDNPEDPEWPSWHDHTMAAWHLLDHPDLIKVGGSYQLPILPVSSATTTR